MRNFPWVKYIPQVIRQYKLFYHGIYNSEVILTIYRYSNSLWCFFYSKKDNSYLPIKHILFEHNGVQHIMCCVFSVLCWQFLWIVHLWMPPVAFSNIYLMKKNSLCTISPVVSWQLCSFSAGNKNYIFIEYIIQRGLNNLYIQPERLYIKLFAVNVQCQER